jgi:hypothetical protein
VKVYSHEIIFTVPGREEEYTQAIAGVHMHPILTGPERAIGSSQLWTWRTAEVSGVFPRVINLWENPTWDRVAQNLKLQFSSAARDPFVEEWWNRNLHLRRGGFDRLLLPVSYAPDDAALTQRKSKGCVFLHEIVQVSAGGVEDYMLELQRSFLPAAERLGWFLMGAYSVVLRPNEAVVIWGLEDWAQWSDLLAATEGDSKLQAWFAYRSQAVVNSEELVLLPSRLNSLRRLE